MTKKSFIEKLQKEREKKDTAKKGLVAVFARKDDIREALEQKYTLREIHTLLVNEGAMPVGYAAFARLVKKYIKNEDSSKTISVKSENLSQTPKENTSSQTGSERPSYVYDPDRNKEKVSKQLGIKSKK